MPKPFYRMNTAFFPDRALTSSNSVWLIASRQGVSVADKHFVIAVWEDCGTKPG
jgi:hypothetical protein